MIVKPKHIDKRLSKIFGARPKKRVRGSRRDEHLRVIREHAPDMKCSITADSPVEYLLKYGRTYSLQAGHIIPYKLLPKTDRNSYRVYSPNGHTHFTNIEMRNKTQILKEEAETCPICGMNNYLYFKRTGFVITFETHHVDSNRKNNNPENLQRMCPNCHAATDTHSFPGGMSFRAKMDDFLQMLSDGCSLDYISNKIGFPKGFLKERYYQFGLDLIFGREKISPPSIIRDLFPNNKANEFFIEVV